ncbi:maleylpyruvate isomerase family mycothiol-dependent enzyme [Streptomyces sp. H10-C2]|uniref:maleylpyruvate isomerase family mycothiol-dependent enzyme n=1 Tax=unclassified Streptomyces TaxID=2593676 RepID=UPI0024B8A386|nr:MULTISPECIES: maleylpyruvate isomerase family mycothiol-dependent enzyme [unclassified Streptomyces]MDJ0340952.1 maleylpyruvate isomerase family mycothiol-dependent enzyme [Streptomyces sp. PH10-H1]MDJ0369816.1 maleylpyruvate isomerase family mycothiol-dependent enzyme [Streptomyces sp. H10-C2]
MPIPGAEWTVGESAAHLVLANELMASLAAGHEQTYGDGTPGGLAAANAASLSAFAERDTSVLADGIVRHTVAFTDAADLRSADEQTVTPLGPMDLGTLGSYLLTHMLGHGYDIAAALGQPHMVDRDRVDLAMPFLITAMPRVVDARAAAGHSACYALRVRGGTRFALTFTDGTATVSAEPPRRPDCTIVAGPVTFFCFARRTGRSCRAERGTSTRTRTCRRRSIPRCGSAGGDACPYASR